jgi:hypothetical protein
MDSLLVNQEINQQFLARFEKNIPDKNGSLNNSIYWVIIESSRNQKTSQIVILISQIAEAYSNLDKEDPFYISFLPRINE